VTGPYAFERATVAFGHGGIAAGEEYPTISDKSLPPCASSANK
jgi:hypothetical protein